MIIVGHHMYSSDFFLLTLITLYFLRTSSHYLIPDVGFLGVVDDNSSIEETFLEQRSIETDVLAIIILDFNESLLLFQKIS